MTLEVDVHYFPYPRLVVAGLNQPYSYAQILVAGEQKCNTFTAHVRVTDSIRQHSVNCNSLLLMQRHAETSRPTAAQFTTRVTIRVSIRLIAIFSPLASFFKQFVILFIFFQLLELLQVPRVFYPFAGFLILLSGRVGTFLLALIFF